MRLMIVFCGGQGGGGVLGGPLLPMYPLVDSFNAEQAVVSENRFRCTRINVM